MAQILKNSQNEQNFQNSQNLPIENALPNIAFPLPNESVIKQQLTKKLHILLISKDSGFIIMMRLTLQPRFG